ncbi:MAG: hypothetical protein ACR2QZ_05905 [Woeseiaceae bacterium]
MNSLKTKDWLELLAAVAVVIGLVLVAYEVRQANIIAKAQAENAIYEGWEVLSMAEIDTGINAVYVSSIRDPASISDAEIADIGSWLVAVMSLYQRNGRLHYEYGLATDPIYDTAAVYFRSQVTRDWFEENESWIKPATPELAESIRRYIESTPLEDATPEPVH